MYIVEGVPLRVFQMLTRFEDAIYWVGCIAAAMILALGVADYWFDRGGLFVFIGWMAVAAIPWLAGEAIRYILTGRW
jgi:hypothetical protein